MATGRPLNEVLEQTLQVNSNIIDSYKEAGWAVTEEATYETPLQLANVYGTTVYPIGSSGAYGWMISGTTIENGFYTVKRRLPDGFSANQFGELAVFKVTPPEVAEPPDNKGGNGTNEYFDGILGSGDMFRKFDLSNDIISNEQELVTRALWSNNTSNLTEFYTSSLQTEKQKRFYFEIYNKDIESSEDCDVEPQFSVAYGHRFGSGSQGDPNSGNFELTPSKAIYGQYRLLCLNPSEDAFVMEGETADSIYVINVNRARMLEHIDEGSIELNLQTLDETGSIVKPTQEVIRIIDDSTINTATVKQSGEIYNLVSGSLEDGIYQPNDPIVFGQLYKRKGILVLNGDKLDEHCNFETSLAQEYQGKNNAHRLFLSISGSAQYDDGTGTDLGFIGRGSEVVKSTHFFVRVKNSDFNYTNNPSFVTGSVGELRHGDMIKDPKVYITTVGLYNSNKELVAVAKLSQPVRKTFKEEALIKVRLDF